MVNRLIQLDDLCRQLGLCNYPRIPYNEHCRGGERRLKQEQRAVSVASRKGRDCIYTVSGAKEKETGHSCGLWHVARATNEAQSYAHTPWRVIVPRTGTWRMERNEHRGWRNSNEPLSKAIGMSCVVSLRKLPSFFYIHVHRFSLTMETPTVWWFATDQDWPFRRARLRRLGITLFEPGNLFPCRRSELSSMEIAPRYLEIKWDEKARWIAWHVYCFGLRNGSWRFDVVFDHLFDNAINHYFNLKPF